MKTYSTELWKGIWKDIKRGNLLEILKFKRLPNIILLGLNGLSNYYGRRWFQGLFFTIIVGLIFYSFFAIATNTSIHFTVDHSNWLICDPNYLKKVLCFLWLPNLDGLKELTNPKLNVSLWGYIWFFLGKIFVAYGYYQTISAFRKYGK